MKNSTTTQPRGLTGRCVLFADVSLDPLLRLGVGAFLVLPAAFLERPPEDIIPSEVAAQVVVRRFKETSSTRLEVQTVIQALEEYRHSLSASKAGDLLIYTDSQCIAGLPDRRPRLERSGFLSTRTHRALRNAELYRTFYELSDNLKFEVVKVAGHTRASTRGTVEHIFSIVDKEARKALRRLQKDSRTL